ncbi:MAG: hypothetical protein ACFE8L_05495 [Candidatus Hodarchaeota archaeon]
MKFSKIEVSRQANFILAIILIHFLFFGSLSNIYKKHIGERLIFLHQVMFDPQSFISFIILFLIVFIIVYREHFFEYGIRNSIWLVPFIMIESWLWHWYLTEGDLEFIGMFFIRIEGYITILSLLGTVLLSAFLAAVVKERIKRMKERVIKVEV